MKFIFIMGPTASGKSSLAIKWAKQYGGVIFNCDSIQVYQGLKIGSATPNSSDMMEIPHYLYSYVPIGGKITAGQYERQFHLTIEQLQTNPSPPSLIWLVGGTGFYFQAIEKGLYPVGGGSSEMRKALLQQWQEQDGPEKLYQELLTKDPNQKTKIHSRDQYRILRAIEIIRINNRALSDIQADFRSKTFPYPLFKVGVTGDKNFFHERVQLRSNEMLKNGLVDEVWNLLKMGQMHWPALQSVGYKETLHFLLKTASSSLGNLTNESSDNENLNNQNLQNGHLTTPCLDSITDKKDFKVPNTFSPQLNESEIRLLSSQITQSTMKLIKKQKTWFQRDGNIRWINGEEILSPSHNLQSLERTLESFIRGNVIG